MSEILEKVRKPGKVKSIYKFVGFGLLGLICLSFMFVGLSPSNLETSGGHFAAIVNDEMITLSEFQKEASRMENQYAEALKNLPRDRKETELKNLRENVLRDMVQRAVLGQKAKEVGLLPTQKELQDQIVKYKEFQKDGRFSQDLYLSLLSANQWTPAQFEALIERDLVQRQGREVFMQALKMPADAELLESQAKNTKLNVRFIKLDKEAAGQGLMPQPKEVEAYIESEAGKAELKKKYDESASEFVEQEKVRARHILVKSDGTDKGNKEAEGKIKKIQDELKSKDFAELAKSYSDDPGSKSKGGDLGFFARGSMVPEFDAAAFSLPVGQLSQPIKTTYGYHLIRVEEKQGGGKRPFDEVKNIIAQNILINKAWASTISEIEQALNEKRDIDAKLKQLGLKWDETGEFDLASPFIPKMGVEFDVLNSLLNHEPQAQSAPKLVRNGDQTFVLAIKTFTKGKATAEQNPFSMAGFEAFNGFMQNLEKKSHVEMNTQLFSAEL